MSFLLRVNLYFDIDGFFLLNYLIIIIDGKNNNNNKHLLCIFLNVKNELCYIENLKK